MRNKKGVELSINTIIIIILAIIVLVVTIFIFSSSMRQVMADLMSKIKMGFGLWNSSQIKP